MRRKERRRREEKVCPTHGQRQSVYIKKSQVAMRTSVSDARRLHLGAITYQKHSYRITSLDPLVQIRWRVSCSTSKAHDGVHLLGHRVAKLGTQWIDRLLVICLIARKSFQLCPHKY